MYVVIIPIVVVLGLMTFFEIDNRKVKKLFSQVTLSSFEREKKCIEICNSIIESIQRINSEDNIGVASIRSIELAGEAEPEHQRLFIKHLYKPLLEQYSSDDPSEASTVFFKFYGGDTIIHSDRENALSKFVSAHPWFKFLEEEGQHVEAYLTSTRIPVHGIHFEITNSSGVKHYLGFKESGFHFETLPPGGVIMESKEDIEAMSEIFNSMDTLLERKSKAITENNYKTIRKYLVSKTSKREKARMQRALGFQEYVDTYNSQVMRMLSIYSTSIQYDSKGNLKVICPIAV